MKVVSVELNNRTDKVDQPGEDAEEMEHTEPADKPSEEMEHTEPADQLDEQMEKLEPTHQPKAKRRKLNRRRKTILSDEELSAVRNGNGLSDIHIVAAQNMIKEEFPELDGLESPLLNQVDGFTAITNSGVQIHHIKDHWVTSSCNGEEVLVYDSRPLWEIVSESDSPACSSVQAEGTGR